MTERFIGKSIHVHVQPKIRICPSDHSISSAAYGIDNQRSI